MRQLAITLVILFLCLAATNVAAPAGGLTPLFSSGAGTRALGMGGANVALANDPSGVFWNPATLTSLPERTLSFMHLPLSEGSRYDYAAFGWPTLDYGSIAVAVFLLTTDDIPRRDADGRDLGTFSANQQLYLIGYGISVNRYLDVGITAKLVGHNIGDLSAYGGGADAGVRFNLSESVKLGMSIQNLVAPSIRLSRESERSPLTIKAGAGVQIPFSRGRNKFSFEVDVDKPDDVDPQFRAGAEIALMGHYFLRAGYDVDQINLGGGVRVGPASFGYTFRTQDYFDAQHRISLDLTLGGSLENILAQRERDRRAAAEAWAAVQRENETKLALAQARHFFQSGMYDSAAVYYQRVAALSGEDDPEAQQRLGEIEQQRTDDLTAYVRAGVLAETDSLRAQELFSDVSSSLQYRDLAAAKLLLDRLRPNFGGSDSFRRLEAEYNMLIADRIQELRQQGIRLLAEGKYAEAASRFDQVLELNPTDAPARQSLSQINTRVATLALLRDGITAFATGDTSAAIQMLNQLLALTPDDAVVLSLLNDWQRSTTDPDASNFSDIQRDTRAWNLYLQGLEKFREGRYEEAISHWEEVLKAYPGNVETTKNIRQAKLRLEINGATN